MGNHKSIKQLINKKLNTLNKHDSFKDDRNEKKKIREKQQIDMTFRPQRI